MLGANEQLQKQHKRAILSKSRENQGFYCKVEKNRVYFFASCVVEKPKSSDSSSLRSFLRRLYPFSAPKIETERNLARFTKIFVTFFISCFH